MPPNYALQIIYCQRATKLENVDRQVVGDQQIPSASQYPNTPIPKYLILTPSPPDKSYNATPRVPSKVR